MVTYESLHDTYLFTVLTAANLIIFLPANPFLNFQTPFRMDYYALCICTAGEIHIEIDHQKYRVSTTVSCCRSFNYCKIPGNQSRFYDETAVLRQKFSDQKYIQPFYH
jgi:hypothetical protein